MMWKAVGAICEVLTLWHYWQLPELARTHLKSKIQNFEVNSYYAQWKNSNFRNFCWMIKTQPISLLKLFLL